MRAGKKEFEDCMCIIIAASAAIGTLAHRLRGKRPMRDFLL